MARLSAGSRNEDYSQVLRPVSEGIRLQLPPLELRA